MWLDGRNKNVPCLEGICSDETLKDNSIIST